MTPLSARAWAVGLILLVYDDAWRSIQHNQHLGCVDAGFQIPAPHESMSLAPLHGFDCPIPSDGSWEYWYYAQWQGGL